MRATSLGWLLVATIVAPTFAGAKEKTQPTPPAPASLTVGDGYLVRVERHGARKQFKGELVKVNDRWLVLRATAVIRKNDSKGITLVSGVFGGSTKEERQEFLWIPRDAVKGIDNLAHASKSSTARIPEGEIPPNKLACVVDTAVRDKVVQRAGGMQAVKDDHVTLSVATKVAFELPNTTASWLMTATERNRPHLRYSRERLAHQDILCIHVPDLDAALRAALTH
jgi:hypothetical protein